MVPAEGREKITVKKSQRAEGKREPASRARGFDTGKGRNWVIEASVGSILGKNKGNDEKGLQKGGPSEVPSGQESPLLKSQLERISRPGYCVFIDARKGRKNYGAKEDAGRHVWKHRVRLGRNLFAGLTSIGKSESARGTPGGFHHKKKLMPGVDPQG